MELDIAPRTPRRLTAKERQLLRKRFGGDATAEQCHRMAAIVNARRFR